MNELIMAALENAKIKFDRLTMGDKEMILDIVKFVCKAQRNACKRVYADNLFDDTYTVIANAKIERCDYE